VYLLNGEALGFHPARLYASTTLLAHDLQRQSDGRVVFQTDTPVMTAIREVTAPILATGPGGRRAIIALSGPLTDGHPADPQVAVVRTNCSEPLVRVENELVVRANLPFATRNTMQKIVG
jgi:hypothetical protein